MSRRQENSYRNGHPPAMEPRCTIERGKGGSRRQLDNTITQDRSHQISLAVLISRAVL